MTANKSTCRRFLLAREQDVSGTSGTGHVAEGVEWSNGWVSLHWLSQLASMEFFESIKTMLNPRTRGQDNGAVGGFVTDYKTTDYCRKCGESPESATHVFGHEYEPPQHLQDMLDKAELRDARKFIVDQRLGEVALGCIAMTVPEALKYLLLRAEQAERTAERWQNRAGALVNELEKLKGAANDVTR